MEPVINLLLNFYYYNQISMHKLFYFFHWSNLHKHRVRVRNNIPSA